MQGSINIFADFNGRYEVNLVSTALLNEHWNQSILLHGNTTIGELDSNNDTFLDRPKGNQLNALYLLNFNDLDHSGFASHFGIQYYCQGDALIAFNILTGSRNERECQIESVTACRPIFFGRRRETNVFQLGLVKDQPNTSPIQRDHRTVSNKTFTREYNECD